MTEFETNVLLKLAAIEGKLDAHLRMHSFVANLLKYGVTTAVAALASVVALHKVW